MSPKITVFFLLTIFSLIICKNGTKVQDSPKQNKVNINPAPIKPQNTTNETFSKRRQRSPFDSEKPYNFSINEIDTIMLCTIVVQEALKKQSKEIERASKRLKLNNSNLVSDKAGADIFEKCNKKINITLVNKYYKNMTFVNEFVWEKEYDEYAEIDYDKYGNESDLGFTVSQQLLMYKFNKVNEIYRYRRYYEREKIEKENRKIKIANVDMESIPLSFKLGLFLVILLIIFGGTFYLLKTLDKKPIEKKKKEKKKKTQ